MKHTNTQKFEQFLQTHGWGDVPISFLAGDCSNRKYYRLGTKNKDSVLLMDAPHLKSVWAILLRWLLC